ncbi:DUF2637 domain-containing protein [Actinoplanes sp. NPDC049118]|uniref:DUF2637 domain-containing protein n=1 Tax=Actinoplanes sp. NPDC049118 TaxID=3155769 RepID=UPI0033C2E976
MATANLASLTRIGWGVRAVFTLGIAASLAGNVLHAQNNVISQAISAWSPLALLLTVELISRIPTRGGAASIARMAATAVIAGIAAWVSYWHMAGVAAGYGETGAAPYLLPLSVDGLIVVASVSLVEIGRRISTLTATDPVAVAEAPPPLATPVPAPAPMTETPAAAVPVAKRRAPKRVTPRPASAAKVAKVAAKMPGAPVAQIAAKAGVSPSTARRHLAALRVTDASPSAPVAAETPVLATAA